MRTINLQRPDKVTLRTGLWQVKGNIQQPKINFSQKRVVSQLANRNKLKINDKVKNLAAKLLIIIIAGIAPVYVIIDGGFSALLIFIGGLLICMTIIGLMLCGLLKIAKVI